MEDVIAARSIMQQSVFKDRVPPAEDPVLILQSAAGRLWIVTAVSLGLGFAALIAAGIALWVSLGN